MLQSKEAGLPPWLARRLITVADYYKMAEAGILSPDDRLELIEGQIIEMPPIGSEHGGRVNKLNRLLVTVLGSRAILSVQNAVRLSDILEPVPDFAVLRPRQDDYTASHPTAPDVLLLIEVADSSLKYDRGVKARLYARHGVPEFWIVDVRARRVSIYRTPEGDSYKSITQLAGLETLTIEALPGIELNTNDIFPD